VENKVTPLAGKTKSQKGRFYYLEVVMGAKLDPCSSEIGSMLQQNWTHAPRMPGQ